MGGRRARSLLEVVGTGLTRQKHNFEQAIASKNPEAVTTTSADLMASSKRAANIIFYASKLSNFIRKVVESGKDLSYSERMSLARKEWSRIKKKKTLKLTQ